MKATAIIAILLLSGCSALRAPSSTESAWLALHAIDTAQTITIAQSPRCLYERDPLARMVYGTRHPSVSRVVVTNVLMGALHWQASEYLETHARWALHVVSFLSTGTAVGNNLTIGIRPAAGDQCGKDPIPAYRLPRSGE